METYETTEVQQAELTSGAAIVRVVAGYPRHADALAALVTEVIDTAANAEDIQATLHVLAYHLTNTGDMISDRVTREMDNGGFDPSEHDRALSLVADIAQAVDELHAMGVDTWGACNPDELEANIEESIEEERAEALQRVIEGFEAEAAGL